MDGVDVWMNGFDRNGTGSDRTETIKRQKGRKSIEGWKMLVVVSPAGPSFAYWWTFKC
jgi:hypothetical protein